VFQKLSDYGTGSKQKKLTPFKTTDKHKKYENSLRANRLKPRICFFFDFSYNNNCSPKLLYTILYSEFDEIGILNRMGKEVFKVN